MSRPALLRPLLAAVVLLVVPAFASADTLKLTLNSSGNPVTYNPNGGTAVTVGAGPFSWTQSAPLNANYPNSITTYCIDLDHYISKGGTYTYTAQTNLALAPTIGNNPAKIAAITELFDRYYDTSLTSAANGAAFQLALWELVYDGGTSKSLTAGRIQASNTQAQNMLNSLGTPYTVHDLTGYHLVALVSSSGNQDQIMVVQNPPTPPGVPAPPGLVLAGMGFGCVLLGRLRGR
jgi:hypothetical protein